MRKAIASMVSALLLVSMAVSMSVVVSMWGGGYLSNYQGATSSADKSSSALGAIAIESVAFDNQSRTVSIIIRNTWVYSIHLISVTVQDQRGTLESSSPNLSCEVPKFASCQVVINHPQPFHFRDNLLISARALEGAFDTTMVFVNE